MEKEKPSQQPQKNDESGRFMRTISVHAIWAMFMALIAVLVFLILQGCTVYQTQTDVVKTKEKRVMRGEAMDHNWTPYKRNEGKTKTADSLQH